MKAQGSAHSLAMLFTPAPDVSTNNPGDEEARERALAQAYQFTAYAIKGNTVFLRCPEGRVEIQTIEDESANRVCKVIFNESTPQRPRWIRYSFWMNASSLKELGDALRAKSETRINFIEWMIDAK